MSRVVMTDLLEDERVARMPLARRNARAPVPFRRSGKFRLERFQRNSARNRTTRRLEQAGAGKERSEVRY